MDKVKFGIIGFGGIANLHMKYLPDLHDVEVAAVCDIDPEALERGKKKCGAPGFDTYQELIDSGLCNAVLIATPHYVHSEIMVYAFEKGLHVLSEKPVGVHVHHARMMNEAAAAHPELVFGVMFQARTFPGNVKAKELIDSGELGKMLRATCVETKWYRTQSYYDSGGWRATWSGEGGGVLLNQCPHTLDIFTWLAGSPQKVIAISKLGGRHRIEVEDEVAAIMEFDDGVFGQFVSSTGEAPGTSIFEFAFEGGLLRVSRDRLQFMRNRVPVFEHIQNSPERFAKPEAWDINVPLPKIKVGGHRGITENFVRCVLHGEKLIAPGIEGIHGLELGNAILLSSLRDNRPVDLPLDGDAMETLIKELCEKSTFVKTDTKTSATDDMESSFH